jgi:hypothetical protein
MRQRFYANEDTSRNGREIRDRILFFRSELSYFSAFQLFSSASVSTSWRQETPGWLSRLALAMFVADTVTVVRALSVHEHDNRA